MTKDKIDEKDKMFDKWLKAFKRDMEKSMNYVSSVDIEIGDRVIVDFGESFKKHKATVIEYDKDSGRYRVRIDLEDKTVPFLTAHMGPWDLKHITENE